MTKTEKISFHSIFRSLQNSKKNLKPYSESPNCGVIKNGITVELSCRNGGEN